VHASPLALSWPTNGTAYTPQLPIEAFIQPTASGKAGSGLFGCYRNHGHRFHGGIDIKSCQRNSKGDPLDIVCATLPGTVAYVNNKPGRSLYGRYIVLKHHVDGYPLYTLYAHLRSIEPNIQKDQPVRQGQTLGVMGHSSSSKIPKQRAHLHFEVGFLLSDNFNAWYDKQQFGSPNYHGNFNGYNLIPLDPLDFYIRAQQKDWESLQAYCNSLPTAFSVEVCSARLPAFLKHYPFLCSESLAALGTLRGWEIGFTYFGFPKSWKPITKPRIHMVPEGHIHLLSYDAKLMEHNPGTQMLTRGKKGQMIPGKRLKKNLELLFGFTAKP
jgi:hypothetical protein